MALVLQRASFETITIDHPDGPIVVSGKPNGKRVDFRIQAPKSVRVLRTELLNREPKARASA